MKYLLIGILALVLATPALAAGETPASQPQLQSQPRLQSQPLPRKPARDMEAILRELRALDSSQDMQGDHVVGEEMC